MARWSGAKARCGYYGRQREYTPRYSPSDPEEGFRIDSFTVSCIGVYLLLFPFTGPLTIVLLVFGSPWFIMRCLSNHSTINSTVDSLKKHFVFRANSVLFPRTRLILSRDAGFELSHGCSLAGANRVIERLNKEKHDGINTWRIPLSHELSAILGPGQDACEYIYKITDKSYPLSSVLKMAGFTSVSSQCYVSKGERTNWSSQNLEEQEVALYRNMIDWTENDAPKGKKVFLWPVSDPKGYVEGYDRDGYDHDGFNKSGLDRDGYDTDGYDWHGYSRKGFNRNGYTREGYNCQGYTSMGYGRDGYNKEGYNRNYIHRDGYNMEGFHLDGYNREGYDRYGYDRKGYNREGLDRRGNNQKGGSPLEYDSVGYNRDGFHRNGYHKDGYHRDGYNREGYDRFGYNREGYDREGFDRFGSDRFGYDLKGLDSKGRDSEGYDIDGYRFGKNREGVSRIAAVWGLNNGRDFNKKGYNTAGYDWQGYDKDGYDREGYNVSGYNRFGYDHFGSDECGVDQFGYDRFGYDQKGYDREGYDREGYDLEKLRREVRSEAKSMTHCEICGNVVSDGCVKKLRGKSYCSVCVSEARSTRRKQLTAKEKTTKGNDPKGNNDTYSKKKTPLSATGIAIESYELKAKTHCEACGVFVTMDKSKKLLGKSYCPLCISAARSQRIKLLSQKKKKQKTSKR